MQLTDETTDKSHIKDIENLIVESNRQVDALNAIGNEASGVEMVELVKSWKSKLVLSSKKLKEHFVKAKKAKERPLPKFNRKDSEDLQHQDSSHWYAHQSPGASNWAEEVEGEWPFGSHQPQPWSRSRWAEQEQEEEEEESFIRGAYRDPFLQVLDKLANRMDRPARPAPPLPGQSSRISIRIFPSGAKTFCPI